jgi:hypothetical protein
VTTNLGVAEEKGQWSQSILDLGPDEQIRVTATPGELRLEVYRRSSNSVDPRDSHTTGAVIAIPFHLGETLCHKVRAVVDRGAALGLTVPSDA